MTLSDFSAAPGDSPTKEEMDSAGGSSPGKGRTQLRPLHRLQGCRGRAEEWGPSPFIPAPSSAGIHQVECPIPALPSPHRVKLAVAGLREARSRQELFPTQLQGRLDFLWGSTAALTHAFLGNRSWSSPALSGLFSWLLSLGVELGESVLWENLCSTFPHSYVHHLDSITGFF